MPVTPRFLSYANITKIANDFLADHHSNLEIPVPIEEIVDVILKIDIVPSASLQHLCEVDAFVSASLDAIYVDAEVYMSPNQNRYRFSLAHEAAHLILHRDIMESLEFGTIPEWKTAIASIPAEDYKWIEWQAYSLAGLLLVPDTPFRADVDASEVLRGQADQSTRDFELFNITNRLADRYHVSSEVIQKRLYYSGYTK